MEVDEGSDKKSDIYSHWMAAHARLKNEFMEDEKCQNLMSWLNSWLGPVWTNFGNDCSIYTQVA